MNDVDDNASETPEGQPLGDLLADPHPRCPAARAELLGVGDVVLDPPARKVTRQRPPTVAAPRPSRRRLAPRAGWRVR